LAHNPPTPEDLWGDCKVSGWDSKNETLWNLWLKNIAVLIIFAEQGVVDRVTESVRSTIEKAKSGELTSDQAVWKISPQSLLRQEEWEAINAAARRDGRMIGQLYFGNRNGSS
jgi:hypothetical protein